MSQLSAKEIFQKTMIFVWMKLGLGAAVAAVNLILGAICIFITWLLSGTAAGTLVMFIAISIWAAGTRAAEFFLNQYIGYLVKAGHVAVVAHAVQTGEIPSDQFGFAKKAVQERFATANVYFALDKMVAGAVREIGRTLDGLAGLLMINRLPGFDKAQALLRFYLDTALGYVDECCLGWTMLHPEVSPFKSAADAVVIYFQNWKELMKLAAKVVAIGILGVGVVGVILAVPLIVLLKIFGGSGYISFYLLLFSILIARAAKNAFLDSWTMVSMTSKFLELAPQTELKVDLYDKLCGLSNKFKELFNKSKEPNPNASAGTDAGAAAPGGTEMPPAE